MKDTRIDRSSIALQRLADHIYNLPESMMRVCEKYEKQNAALIQLTGYDITELIELFAVGYILEPPKYEGNKFSELKDMDK